MLCTKDELMRGTLALTRKTRGQQKALIKNKKILIQCKRLSLVHSSAINLQQLNNTRSVVLNSFGSRFYNSTSTLHQNCLSYRSKCINITINCLCPTICKIINMFGFQISVWWIVLLPIIQMLCICLIWLASTKVNLFIFQSKTCSVIYNYFRLQSYV